MYKYSKNTAMKLFFMLLMTVTHQVTFAVDLSSIGSPQYKQDLETAESFRTFAQGLEFSTSNNKMSGSKYPFRLHDMRLMAKAWQTELAQFCVKIDQHYMPFYKSLNADIQIEADVIESINDDFNLSQTHRQCIAFKEKAERYINYKFDAKKEIPRLLDSVLSENYERARNSSVMAKKLIGDRNSSIAHTRVYSQFEADQYIGIYEILSNNNEQSVRWRKQYSQIVSQFQTLALDNLEELSGKIALPNDRYPNQDGATLRQKIAELIGGNVEQVFLQSSDMDKENHRLIGANNGQIYQAISFYVVFKKGSQAYIDYGWFEQSTEPESDQGRVILIGLNEALPFANSEALISNESVLQVEAVEPKIEQATQLGPGSISSLGAQSKTVPGFVGTLALTIEALVLLIAGLMITQTKLSTVLPQKIKPSFTQTIARIAPASLVIAGLLVALGLYSFYLSLIYLSVVSLLMSVISLLAALVLYAAKVQNNKNNWSVSLRKIRKYEYPIGFAAIAAFFIKLVGLV